MSQFFPGPGPLQDEFESVKEDVTALNDNIAKVQNGLAYIVGNTNTTGSTLIVGQFVYVKGHSTIAEGLRKVTASISANGSITTSNTEVCAEGGLNALNSNLTTKLTGKIYYHEHTNITYNQNGLAYIELPQFSGGVIFPLQVNCADATPHAIVGRNWDSATIVSCPNKAGQTEASLIIHYIIGAEAQG